MGKTQKAETERKAEGDKPFREKRRKVKGQLGETEGGRTERMNEVRNRAAKGER